MSTNNLIAKKYADALFLVTKNLNRTINVYEELNSFLSKVGDDKEMKRLIINKFVPRRIKLALCDIVFKHKRFSKIVKKFIYILVSKKRLFLLEKIAFLLKKLINDTNNIELVEIILVDKVNERIMGKIKNKLTEYFQDKILEFRFSYDRKILGGIVIKVGSMMCDFSILSKLRNMQSMIQISTLQIIN